MILEEKPSLEELVDEMKHYGTPRHSGRYPWGSGKDPYQHTGDFLNRINEMKKDGLTTTEIGRYFEMSSGDFRAEHSAAINEKKRLEYEKILSLKEKGYSNYKIAEMMGFPNESTVRSRLDEHAVARMLQGKQTADFLKERLKEKGFIDISKGTNKYLGNVSQDKMNEAVHLLKMEGYMVYKKYVPQPTNPGQNTTIDVLCPIDYPFEDFMKVDSKDIHPITDFKTHDEGQTYQPKNVYPKSLDSKRLMIRYADDAGSDGVKGIEKDGIIELRRGVDDISLGNDRYAQVRILVDGDRYLKGMAVYSDNMPDGVDVVFNTNKTKDIPMRDVLKKTKNNELDPDNPFGTTIKSIEEGGQYYYTDKNGNKQLSVINKKSAEGDWEDWANALPSQFLSKQNIKLAERQINLAMDEKNDTFNEICSLTNPTVKKKLLQEFASNCDSAAVHLKAAALPRQRYHVILPINALKEDEIYAPGYENGEKVALIRYPHGGTFEIPILTVNNKHAVARKILPSDVMDAVGINSKVAERLSGADFDGDTVMVIPTDSSKGIKITSTDPLPGLEGFDPKVKYATVKVGDDYVNAQGIKIKTMPKARVQNEMGSISNLITDMTIKNATDEEKARAVRHSMVVIDAEKHKLDYKQSERDNNIAQLKKLYQGGIDPLTGKYSEGSSTILSRAKSEYSIPKTQGMDRINKKGKEWYDPSKPEGALITKPDNDPYYPERLDKKKTGPDKRGFRLANGKTVMYDVNDKEAYQYYKPVKKYDDNGEVYFTNSTGELIYNRKLKKQKTTKMAVVDDAMTLVSSFNAPMERLYANYANKLKALANEARKEMVYTNDIEYSKAAANTYKEEVNSLLARLNEAEKNSPKERRAVLLADSSIKQMKAANPDMTKAEIKKYSDRFMNKAREAVGAKRMKIELSDRDWEAIQAGAISKTKLNDILKYADMDIVKQKAMPKATKTLTAAQISNLQARIKSGRYTTQELANQYGVSVSTIIKYTKGKE